MATSPPVATSPRCIVVWDNMASAAPAKARQERCNSAGLQTDTAELAPTLTPGLQTDTAELAPTLTPRPSLGFRSTQTEHNHRTALSLTCET